MYLHDWGDNVKNCNSCQQRQPTGKNMEKEAHPYWSMGIILISHKKESSALSIVGQKQPSTHISPD